MTSRIHIPDLQTYAIAPLQIAVDGHFEERDDPSLINNL